MLKPKLVVSACLAGEDVRYDGVPVKDPFALKLCSQVETISVCPEVSIGLGVPRDRIILVEEEEPRLYQPATGRELTGDILSFTEGFLKGLPPVDGFLLKAKSPSCGVSHTKVYKDREGKELLGLGEGIFAREVRRSFPHVFVEDELGLRDRNRRLRFLVGIYMLALFRHRGNLSKVKCLKRAVEELPEKALVRLAQKLVPKELLEDDTAS